MLGNLLNLPGFDYQSSEEVLAEDCVRPCAGTARRSLPRPARRRRGHARCAAASRAALADVPMYQTDALVRRAPSLQKTREGRAPLH